MTNIVSLLAEKISAKKDEISAFFSQEFSANPALFYNSADLRNARFKIAPIDVNCFPAGFNNFDEDAINKGAKLAFDFFKENNPQAKKLLIIPENHTRNLKYLENVKNLEEILAKNFEVKIGSLIEDLKGSEEIKLENGKNLTLNQIRKDLDKIATFDDFEPDVIILNNDLSEACPEILKNITQEIYPSPNLGWHQRLKSEHFSIYNKLAEKLANILEIDPWLISTIHDFADEINFKEKTGLENLANKVDEILAKIKEKYQEYGLNDEPFCFVKADSGTYGMAIWPVSSGEEILQINKKERNKMNKTKGLAVNSRVLIQEGVVSKDKILGKFAEPMIYLINGQIAANLFRSNETRSEKTSLNSPGAEFFDLEKLNNDQIDLGASKEDLILVYDLIARLGALASSCEK